MSVAAPKPDKAAITLLPHQTAFIETVMRADDDRVVLLRGDVGIGKTTAVGALVARFLRERSTSRVLILCHAALREQWVATLRGQGASAVLVDRYRFREMLDAEKGVENWRRGVAVVLSNDFALERDVRTSLAKNRWDLIVADEGDRFTGDRAEQLRNIGGRAERVVVTARPDLVSLEAFPLDNVTVVDWRRGELRDHDGSPLDALRRPILHEVIFTQSEAEVAVSESVGALCDLLESGNSQQRFTGTIVRRMLGSSSVALESALRRLAVASEGALPVISLVDEPTEMEEQASVQVASTLAEKVRALAIQSLEQVENLGPDAKLKAFGELLDNLARQDPRRRVCVVAEFRSTLYYLSAEVEQRDLELWLLHGGMRRDAAGDTLTTFANEDGILLATIAVLEGLDVPNVTDLVLYDLPDSTLSLEQILARFDRFGRTSPLHIHAFVESRDAGQAVLKQLRLLCDEIGSGE